MKRTLTKWDGKAIPPERWGKDHRSTLLYVETRCVDYGGKLDRRQLRIGSDEHPTRLADGVDLAGHDDLDCIADFEAAGLLRNHGTGLHPAVSLTDTGWIVAGNMRREKAQATADRQAGR